MRPIKPVEPAYYKVIDPDFEIEIKSIDENGGKKIFKTKISDAIKFLAEENRNESAEHENIETEDDKNELAHREKIEKKLHEIYRRSLLDLLEKFGDVCAYCGVRIQTTAHVEHVEPKSLFPEKMFEWSNFLPACRDCNSAKRNRPTREQDGAFGDYVWPQLDFLTGMIRESLRPCRLRPDNDGHFEPVDQGEPIDLVREIEVKLTRTDNRQTVYRFAGSPEPPGEPMDVEPDGTGKGKRKRPSDDTPNNPWVPFFAFSEPAAGNAKVERTVDHLFVLNRFTSTEKVSDRRAVARARAWMQARNVVRLLKAQETNQPSDKAREALHGQMRQIIKQTGFWSVWYQMFKTTAAPFLGGNGARIEFVDFLKSNAFPGTDTGRIP